MPNLKQLAHIINMNINTLRYQLRENKLLYIDGLYDVDLYSMLELKVKKQKLKHAKLKERIYSQYFIEESKIPDFVKELNKFWEHKRASMHKQTAWNETAIECFDNNGCSKKCKYFYICRRIGKQENHLYPMQNKVMELIEEYGEPSDFDRSRVARSIISQF